jgi:hypothetical protein
LGCLESSLKLRLTVYERMYRMSVQTLFLISTKSELVNSRIGSKEK